MDLDLPRPLLFSAVEWLAFVGYWSWAAKNALPAKASESRNSRRVHEILVNAALLFLFIHIPGLRHRLLPEISSVAALGLTIQSASLALAVWARRHLGGNWSGEITIKVDHRLIRSGPYRLVRHPIYTALLGMFLGTAIASGELHAAIGLAMAVYSYCRKIRLEEANLRDAFGPAYDAYRSATWALIPGLL